VILLILAILVILAMLVILAISVILLWYFIYRCPTPSPVINVLCHHDTTNCITLSRFS